MSGVARRRVWKGAAGGRKAGRREEPDRTKPRVPVARILRAWDMVQHGRMITNCGGARLHDIGVG